MAFRSSSVTGKGIVYSRRRGRGFAGRSLASRGKPSVIFEESEESDHALQPAMLRTRLQSQQNDDGNASRSAFKDKSNVTRSPKRQEAVLGSLGSTTVVSGIGGDTIKSHGGEKVQILFSTSNSSVGKSGQDIMLEPQVFISGANLEVGTPRERVDSNIDSHELPTEQSLFDVPSKEPNSGNSDKGKGNSSRKGSRIASSRGCKSQARKSLIPSGTNPLDREQRVRSLDKSSRPVVQIQKQNHREVDRSLEGEPSAPNTSTKTKKNTPFQTEKVADFEIQDHEYDRRTEIANPVEQDKVDREQLQFNDIEATLPSSPPYSPPKIPIEKCLQTTLDLSDYVQPSSTPFKQVNPEDCVTPSQSDDPTINKAPPRIRRQVNFWNSPSSRPIQEVYISSPCPATDMRTEDFVMLRRKREIFTDEDDLEPAPPQLTTVRRGVKAKKCAGSRMRDRKMKGKDKAARGDQESEVDKKKSGSEKWVRFLDVAISCPSDESDELSICKPSWMKKEVAGQTAES